MALFTHIDWDSIRSRVAQEAWARQVLDAMCGRIDRVIATGITVPDQPGGWIHDYVCPDHWLPLTYDSASPHHHQCLQGETRTSEKINAAWRVQRHRELADAARDAGLVYRLTGETAYCETARDILRQYAGTYRQFAGDADAQPWMLKGRAFNQALTEALWAVPVAQAYDLLAGELGEQDHALLRDQLLVPISATMVSAHDQLLAQDRMHSNYTAWLNAALGCLGGALGDDALVERAVGGPGGFWSHIAAAVRPDGLEYEGSLYYHNFVTLAYILLAEAVQGQEIDLYRSHNDVAACSIFGMVEALAALAWPDGSFPQLNDGAYWTDSVYDAELCAVYEVAFARFQHPRYAWLLRQAYARRGVPRDCWLALLLGHQSIADVPAPQPEPVLLGHSGIALLAGAANTQVVCIAYGPYGGSHHHFDRLSPVIWPWSPDAGNPPYGVTARREWYQQTAAHNALLVDGQGQQPAGATVLQAQADRVSLQSPDLYPGVMVTRGLQVAGELCTDRIVLESEDNHNYTWLCHADVDALWEFSVAWQEVNEALTGDGPGAQITLIRQASVVDRVTAVSRFAGQKLTIEIACDGPFMVGMGVCPGGAQTPHQPRYVLVAQKRAKICTFSIDYTFER